MIRIPPLRRRPMDISALAEHFLQMESREGVSPKHFMPEAMDALMAHGWPGNVRELRNAVRFALAASSSSDIHARDLPDRVRIEQVLHDEPRPAELSLAAFEGAALHAALKRADGNASRAARALGISRATFYRKLRRSDAA